MESLLGFHPPHFSEEAAWLPGWLQSSTIREASIQAFQCSSGQRLEEIGCFQQNTCTRENENLSDNGGCKSFHLFLSGEDNSTMNLPSCSSNHEIRYHLHLSSNGESQSMSNPDLSKSQSERPDLNQPLIVHQPDSKVTTPEKNTQEVNISSQQKGNAGTSSGHEPLSLKGQNRKPPKSHKVDILDAVELAVAASEALIIHEVVKDEPSTQLSTPSSVLEAAIRVKQARLEELKDNLVFEDSNEVDFLSDLDELTMADAYEDVGLTVTSHGDLSGYESISHVKDSYGGLEADFGSISPKQELLLKRGFVLDSIEGGKHKEGVDLGCDVDLIFSCSVEKPNFGTKEVNQRSLKIELQRVGFAIGDPTSCQTALRSSPASGHNDKEDMMTSLLPDRFQSRWFGGWNSTTKNKVTDTDDKHKKTTPEVFDSETSSLSESADIAPDMNSGIQKQDNTVSQSSIAPKDTHERDTNNDNLLLEDVEIFPSNSAPNASPVDPLCSVVPCSFTSDTPPLTHHNLMSPGPTPQLNLDNTKTADSLHEKTQPISEINSVRRQVSSLKTYSMLSYPPYHPTSKPDTALPSHIDKITNLPMTVNSEENPNPESNMKSCLVPMRKRVRFTEPEISVKKRKTRVQKHGVMLLRNLKFLITGFSIKKHKEIKNLVQKNGGIVLDDIPSPPTHRTKRFSKHRRLPLVLCPKRLLTTKFLYACAVNACILKVNWLFDSVNQGSILPPKKYTILKENATSCNVEIGMSVSRMKSIFEDVAIMLHGKRDFCAKMVNVIKHGGGLVFKTFHWLVRRLEGDRVLIGVIVVEDENGISHQLKQCAVEQNIAVLNFDWVVKSLYAGRVVPSPEFMHQSASLLSNKVNLELSEEI